MSETSEGPATIDRRLAGVLAAAEGGQRRAERLTAWAAGAEEALGDFRRRAEAVERTLERVYRILGRHGEPDGAGAGEGER
jgi:hypothetical protein